MDRLDELEVTPLKRQGLREPLGRKGTCGTRQRQVRPVLPVLGPMAELGQQLVAAVVRLHVEAAIEDLNRWLERNEGMFEEPHYGIAEARYWLGEAEMAAGRPQNAIPLFESARSMYAEVFGPDHYMAQRAAGSLARATAASP